MALGVREQGGCQRCSIILPLEQILEAARGTHLGFLNSFRASLSVAVNNLDVRFIRVVVRSFKLVANERFCCFNPLVTPLCSPKVCEFVPGM